MTERWRGESDDDSDIDEEADWDDGEADVESDEEAETVECPHCGEEIFEDSVRCPYCGDYLSSAGSLSPSGRPIWWVVGAAMALASCVGFVLFFR
jgi:DNA-directed RNA polymerase subunit RPC12/RpoP